MALLELREADLNDLCNAKTRRVEALKQQGIESERNRVEVLKAAKQSIRAAALKFQSQAVLAEQAIADNQLLKEELLSAHRVMEGFKEKARRLTHMKRELADLRAEVGEMAKVHAESEERAASEVIRSRQETHNMKLRMNTLEQQNVGSTFSSNVTSRSPGPSGRHVDRTGMSPSPSPSPSPKPPRDSSRKSIVMSVLHGQAVTTHSDESLLPLSMDHGCNSMHSLPAVRGASPLPKVL